jgi:hypothetical protein
MTRGNGPTAALTALGVAVVLGACSATFKAFPDGGTYEPRGDTSVAWGAKEGLPCVRDVPGQLSRLRRYGVPLGFHRNGTEPVGGYHRHWQGVQRAARSGDTYLFVSRSGSATAVLVVELASRPSDGGPLGATWSKDPLSAKPDSPPDSDRVVARIPFDSGFSHAGGLALTGTVLAVPMDGGGRSQVAFYDVAQPRRPRRLYAFDHSKAPRPSTGQEASAVALGRIADGRYLLVLGVRSSKILEFFVSNGELLRSEPPAWQRIGIRTGQAVGGFQNLAILTQCDGAMFLVGTHNTALPPPSRGRDHLHWYQLAVAPGGRILLQKGGERWMHCSYCNFAAGGGLYQTPHGDVLLYATGFWTRSPGEWVALEEFTPDTNPQLPGPKAPR